jgi:hypothetical protein
MCPQALFLLRFVIPRIELGPTESTSVDTPCVFITANFIRSWLGSRFVSFGHEILHDPYDVPIIVTFPCLTYKLHDSPIRAGPHLDHFVRYTRYSFLDYAIRWMDGPLFCSALINIICWKSPPSTCPATRIISRRRLAVCPYLLQEITLLTLRAQTPEGIPKTIS